MLLAISISCIVAAAVCLFIALPRRGRGAEAITALVVALLLLLTGGAAAAIHEKVSGPATPAPTAAPGAAPASTSSSATTWPLEELPNFRGAPAIHSGALARPLCLVRYYARHAGQDPGANWWTTCAANKAMTTVSVVRRRLALPVAWGARDARVFATIPAGQSVVYVQGTAARQCEPKGARCYPGGGAQLLFVNQDFQRSWFTRYECASTENERALNAFHACAG